MRKICPGQRSLHLKGWSEHAAAQLVGNRVLFSKYLGWACQQMMHDPAMDHLRCQLPCSSRPAAHFPVLMGLESSRVGLLSLEACPQGHTLGTSGRSSGRSTLPGRSYECSRHLTGCPSPCSKICTNPSQIGQTAALSWTKELLANTGHWHSAWSSSGPRVPRDCCSEELHRDRGMRLQLFRYFTAFSLNVFAPVRNKPNLFNLQICNLSLGFGKRVLAWATATIQSDNDMTRPAATEKQQGQNQQKVPSQGKIFNLLA